MPTATVNGLSLAYDVIGETGRPWVLTPGGRFSKDYPGVRELAEALAARGNRVLVWDRPNCGASHVSFDGDSESVTQADALAGLLETLDMAPAVIAGGSGGSRVSLLAAARHPGLATGLALWWLSGGVYGLINLGMVYCSESIVAAWNGGMEAVVELPQWHEVLTRNPENRQRFLDLDPREFIDGLERWMDAYCPCGTDSIPGMRDTDLQAIDVPALVFRSGAADASHPRVTSETVAALLPNSRLVEPPWPDDEWNQRRADGLDGLFVRWPLLAPTLADWVDVTLP